MSLALGRRFESCPSFHVITALKTFSVSLPYIYPVCPLNIDHARMFVISDIISRYSRNLGYNVFFPVASHYSGNTAQKVSNEFRKVYINNRTDDQAKKTVRLHESTYGTPDYTLKNFCHPDILLDYYSQEILWELKSLRISCDYDLYYTTRSEDFAVFVNTIMDLYKKHKVLIDNAKGKLALNYDNSSWKDKVNKLFDKTEFVQEFQKGNVKDAMKNVRSDWGFLRRDGYGVQYKQWIVDPMFDSELFTVYNIFVKLKREYPCKLADAKSFFANLFEALATGDPKGNPLISEFLRWLPCDVFVCEEHLKNWIVKRLYAETLLLEKKFRTKKYFITGMGLLSGKRMSASQGHAILARDLINDYGPLRARLIILLTGGHPSRIYHYEPDLPKQAGRLLKKVLNYSSYLRILINYSSRSASAENSNSVKRLRKRLKDLLERGYYKTIILELITVTPKRFCNPDQKTARELFAVYKEYFDLLLPGLVMDL